MSELLSQYVERLLIEGRRLSGKDLQMINKTRFIDLVYYDLGREYIYARVEIATGNIYSQSGKTPRGNIFEAPYYGFNLIGDHGVIVNKPALLRRLQELNSI